MAVGGGRTKRPVPLIVGADEAFTATEADAGTEAVVAETGGAALAIALVDAAGVDVVGAAEGVVAVATTALGAGSSGIGSAAACERR